MLRLLAKSDTFYWSKAEEDEFLYLKFEALKSIARLGYFHPNHVTELYVDASPIGLGAVLIQFDEEEKPRIISCASKALSDTEKKYPQTQKEALAMVWAVERFAFYLTSKSFTIRTDSEANEFIFGNGHRSSKRAITRAESWALRLQSFDFLVKRVPSHLNLALSRLIARTQSDEPFDDDNDKHVLYAVDSGYMNITWKDIEFASESDEDLCTVRAALTSGIWPEHLRRFEVHCKVLRIFGSIVFKDDKTVLPSNLRSKALATAHQGHIGCAAMKRIMREYFWWPGMSKDVEKFVKECRVCLVISKKNPPIPLTSRKLPDGPWQMLQIDFLSVPGCGSGELLVCVDTYSRYLSVMEIKAIDAKTTNSSLSKNFHVWGLPLTLQSDNGPPFQGHEFISYWESKGVKVYKSIPLHLQSNGLVERQNQGIIKALAGAKESGYDWRKALQEYVHVHNTVKPHARLGVTPFELLVGWKYRGTFPSLWDAKDCGDLDRSDVRDTDDVAKLISKQYADQRRGAKCSDIVVGD
ncbi:uncharacterized protein K02A2.6-like [Topomyia yanbarensis]|uniref:uncharacterized protein K02A2.6-like n=1 Tax=Topomyia yanbarensis TaxID=2498891 RepID=UPI00273BF66A|nr:uncharacterized protein K02A2.6-like [Topomyia yanbarensis]